MFLPYTLGGRRTSSDFAGTRLSDTCRGDMGAPGLSNRILVTNGCILYLQLILNMRYGGVAKSVIQT